MNQTGSPIRFVRTTAIGGLLFLLPLIVVGALIGQMVPIVLGIAETLGGMLPGFLKTPYGIALLISLAISILLLLCFAAGLLARHSIIRGLSERFEKQLLLLFPRYAILKDQMADSIGGDQSKPQMKPILVRFDDCRRIGFETERDEETQIVAVYFPGSPDPWAGKVVLVSMDRVEALRTNFGATVATFEQLGRGSVSLLEESQSREPKST